MGGTGVLAAPVVQQSAGLDRLAQPSDGLATRISGALSRPVEIALIGRVLELDQGGFNASVISTQTGVPRPDVSAILSTKSRLRV